MREKIEASLKTPTRSLHLKFVIPQEGANAFDLQFPKNSHVHEMIFIKKRNLNICNL